MRSGNGILLTDENVLMLRLALGLAALFAVCWLAWQLLRQNGRMLLRVEGLEKRLDELEFVPSESRG